MRARTPLTIGAALGVAALGALAARRDARIRLVPDELRLPLLRVPLSLPHAAVTPLARLLLNRTTPVLEGVTTNERKAPGLPGTPNLSVVLYEPDARVRPSGALLWLHGGGLIVGTPAMGHTRCSHLARELGILVASVDYRLAPEDPYPAAIDDAFAALLWLREQASALGIDPARIAVGGDSAGGGLAACLAQRAHDAGIEVAFQLLVYPMLDDRTVLHPPRVAGPLTWTPASNRTGWTAYVGQAPGESVPGPYAAASRREDLNGLAPAWIGVGTFDLFHDEDVAYAARLREAGVPCELLVVDGMYHGADAVGLDHVPAVADFWRSLTQALRGALAG